MNRIFKNVPIITVSVLTITGCGMNSTLQSRTVDAANHYAGQEILGPAEKTTQANTDGNENPFDGADEFAVRTVLEDLSNAMFAALATGEMKGEGTSWPTEITGINITEQFPAVKNITWNANKNTFCIDAETSTGNTYRILDTSQKVEEGICSTLSPTENPTTKPEHSGKPEKSNEPTSESTDENTTSS